MIGEQGWASACPFCWHIAENRAISIEVDELGAYWPLTLRFACLDIGDFPQS